MYEEFSALDKNDVTEFPEILSFAMETDFVNFESRALNVMCEAAPPDCCLSDCPPF